MFKCKTGSLIVLSFLESDTSEKEESDTSEEVEEEPNPELDRVIAAGTPF